MLFFVSKQEHCFHQKIILVFSAVFVVKNVRQLGQSAALTGPICLFDNLIESHKVRDIFMAIFNQEHLKQVSLVQ